MCNQMQTASYLLWSVRELTPPPPQFCSPRQLCQAEDGSNYQTAFSLTCCKLYMSFQKLLKETLFFVNMSKATRCFLMLIFKVDLPKFGKALGNLSVLDKSTYRRHCQLLLFFSGGSAAFVRPPFFQEKTFHFHQNVFLRVNTDKHHTIQETWGNFPPPPGVLKCYKTDDRGIFVIFFDAPPPMTDLFLWNENIHSICQNTP